MKTRSRIGQISSLEDRLFKQADDLRRQAKEMPHGVRREELLRKARQAETAAGVDGCLSSPGLSPGFVEDEESGARH